MAIGEDPKVRLKVYPVIERNKGDRAGCLRTEADNCLKIAVREESATFAAQLIDEAAKLIKRSSELLRSSAAPQ
jgi:hypothetical protein